MDRQKIGEFVAERRRKKGMTQKELAEKLYISDKAVSKWETGVSIPDTGLLVPLSELLDVSVTELLMGEHIENRTEIESEKVELLIKSAIGNSFRSTESIAGSKKLWGAIYAAALIIGGAGLIAGGISGASSTVGTVFVLSAVFGAYFCFIVISKLPGYYDENRISGVYQSAFRMNVPGLYFNNSNWPYIILTGRIWSCASLAVYPVIGMLLNRFTPLFWSRYELYICFFLVMGGLVVPMYTVGRKFE